MEALSSTAKRKKRKTRKCLDELRKRSRRNDSMGNSHTNCANVCTGNIKETNSKCTKSNNLITSKRLTLAMFPKAIRSETITRPVLPPNRNEHGIRDEVIVIPSNHNNNCRQSSNSQCDVDVVENSEESNSSSLINYEMGPLSIQQESEREKVSTPVGTPGSLFLFSPVDQPAHTDSSEVSAVAETVSTPSISSQNARETYGFKLYEEFMNEIPTHLNDNAPALIKEDVTKKTKLFLNDIYKESCRRECEDNILQCIKASSLTSDKTFTPSEVIVQNPMDYLKLGYSWRRRRDTSNASSAGAGAPRSPASPPRRASPRARAPSPATALIHDTPEYTYFPHKLNQ